MTYRVTDYHDNTIASYDRITVGPAGELYCRKEFGSRVEITFAPGTWQNYFWDDDDD